MDSMRIIDFHTHCFADKIAERGIASLREGYGIIPTCDGTVSGLLAQMDATGIEASVVCPVATKPTQVQTINDWVAGIDSPRIIKFGAMHPDFPNPAEEMRRMESLGILGIKIQPNWQDCRPDDPRMLPIYEAAQGKFIMIFHGGKEFKVFPEELARPQGMANVHRMFPGLTMVVAHLGGFRMWDEVEEFLVGEDIYLDTSCCLPGDISEEQMYRIIRTHGVEKILFATDAPCMHPVPQFERVMSLPLSDGEKEMIAWRNAARLLGLS